VTCFDRTTSMSHDDGISAADAGVRKEKDDLQCLGRPVESRARPPIHHSDGSARRAPLVFASAAQRLASNRLASNRRRFRCPLDASGTVSSGDSVQRGLLPFDSGSQPRIRRRRFDVAAAPNAITRLDVQTACPPNGGFVTVRARRYYAPR
jgi:hypothetical protein